MGGATVVRDAARKANVLVRLAIRVAWMAANASPVISPLIVAPMELATAEMGAFAPMDSNAMEELANALGTRVPAVAKWAMEVSRAAVLEIRGILAASRRNLARLVQMNVTPECVPASVIVLMAVAREQPVTKAFREMHADGEASRAVCAFLALPTVFCRRASAVRILPADPGNFVIGLPVMSVIARQARALLVAAFPMVLAPKATFTMPVALGALPANRARVTKNAAANDAYYCLLPSPRIV